MALIQDIKPNGSRAAFARNYRATQRAAVQQIKRAHQATIIPPLTMEPVKRMYQTRTHRPISRPAHYVSRSQNRTMADIRPQSRVKPQQPIVQPEPAQKQAVLPKQPIAQKIPQKRKVRARIFDFLQYPLFTVIALGAAWSPVFGQACIAIYALISIIWKWNSKVTFGLALFMLFSITIFSLLGQTGISDNVALYAYELLLTGAVQVTVEIWRTRRVAPH